jgi:hypothetical protein
MRYFAKSLIISLATSNIAYATPALSNTLNYKAPKKSTVRKIVENFKFSYLAKYTGRSLSDGYADGATYNRFGGGRSAEGQRRDTTGSEEIFHAFTLGYKLPKNMILSFGLTFQDNLTKDVEFEGDYGQTLERSNGRSYNNQRISLFIPGVLSNNKMSLSTSVFYELPTNDFSRDAQMEYGYGIQPSLAIYSNIPGLFHGITASYERYVYPDYEFYGYYTPTNPDGSAWKNPDGSPMSLRNSNPTKRQGMLGNIGAYANYVLTDKTTLKSSVQFDYDQQGDQVGSTSEFGNNLDNVGNLGLGYSLSRNIYLESGVTFSLEEAGLDKTAIFGTFVLSI